MDTFILVVELLGVIGIWLSIVWFSKAIKNQNTITDSLNKAFDSMKTSVDYISSVHSTVKRLYDPDEIEKLVSVKIDLIKADHKKELDDLKIELDDHVKTREEIVETLKGIKTRAFEMIDRLIDDVKAYGEFSARASEELGKDQTTKILECLENNDSKERVREVLL